MKKNAIGFFVKSGKAVAVLLNLEKEPLVLDRRMIALADPAVPDSIQPFHVFETKSGREAELWVEKLKKIVAGVCEKSVQAILKDYQKLGHPPDRAALVVGSTIDPDKLKNEHIRWHALEGQLFRTSLETALLSNNLKCSIFLSKEIFQKSSALLKKQEAEIRSIAKELGQSMGSWRLEEKSAALAAWISCYGKSTYK